ncbi:MAG TPA: hypothetical protein VMX14_06120 [Anaerolineae bacterium]|nr:hypothetical protein [Anaerolineae bacterium]
MHEESVAEILARAHREYGPPGTEAQARAYIAAVREAQKNSCYECWLPRCPECGMAALPFESYCVKCGTGKFIHTLYDVVVGEDVLKRAWEIWMAEVVCAPDEPEPTLPRRDGRVAAELLRVASRLVELAAELIEDG